MTKKLLLTATILMAIIVTSLTGYTLCESQSSYYLIKENTYLNIITSATLPLEGRLTLTASWYVKKTAEPDVNENGTLYKVVEFNGVKGKVEASKLSVKTTTISGSAHYSTKITTQSKSGGKIFLFKDSEADIMDKSISAGEEITFLSRNYSQNLTYLIEYNSGGQNMLAFIQAVDTTNNNVIVDSNPNIIDPDAGGSSDGGITPPINKTPDAASANVTRILLIVAICVLAVLIIFLIFKPSKPAKKDDYYDA